MKIIVNRCYGGYQLSAKAVNRMAELQGKECYFFYYDYSKTEDERFQPIKLEDINETKCLLYYAYDIPNPQPNTEEARKHRLSFDGDTRTDPYAIQAVTELKEEASTWCSKLEVVDIPDGIVWEVDDYDGFESIEEAHRSW